MGRGWIYAVGWALFAICVAIALPPRVKGIQMALRDRIEDDLDASNLSDIGVTMDGQAATVAFRAGAGPWGDVQARILKAADIAATEPGGFARRSKAGGILLGPVTVVRIDQGSLAHAKSQAASVQAAAAASASQAAAGECTKRVVSAVAERKLNFVSDSAELTPESQTVISDVFATLKTCPDGLVLHVEGHTDDVGGLDHNLQLSAERAATAADALLKLGISENAVVSQGFGPEAPIADNKTEDGRAKNRRVDFILKPA